jgi:Carboxypeptidase regulatory-like domain
MIGRAFRMTGVCLVAVATLGLTACDTGPVVLEGTLTHSETGAPLDGIPVRVYSSTEEDVLVARARTGADGTYRVRAGLLAEGTYRVRFSTDHWWENGDSWSTARDVAVSAGQPSRLDAALVPTMTRVWGQTSCCGGPSPDVRVDVFHADTGALVATTQSVETLDCTGCYELELAAGDIYTFRAEHPTFGWTTAWYWQPGGPAGGFGVELPPGEREVSFGLTQESAFLGRVVDTAGSPITGARVLAIPSRSPVPPKPQEATTGADGAFGVGGLALGYYRLLVIAPDGTWTLAGMIGGDPETATEFFLDFFEFPNVGDITLGGP